MHTSKQPEVMYLLYEQGVNVWDDSDVPISIHPTEKAAQHALEIIEQRERKYHSVRTNMDIMEVPYSEEE